MHLELYTCVASALVHFRLLLKSRLIDTRGQASLKGCLDVERLNMDDMREEDEQLETDIKAEIIYWATGRTKIYPEKSFDRRYAEIKTRSEQKRKKKDEDKSKVGLTE